MTPHEKWLRNRQYISDRKIKTIVLTAKFIHVTGIYNGYAIRPFTHFKRLQLIYQS